MEIVKVICKAEDKEFLPVYSSAEAAGADLKACIQDDIVLKPGQRYLVPTGLSIQLPEGYEAQIRPRSGLAIKYGISLVNAPGTIRLRGFCDPQGRQDCSDGYSAGNTRHVCTFQFA